MLLFSQDRSIYASKEVQLVPVSLLLTYHYLLLTTYYSHKLNINTYSRATESYYGCLNMYCIIISCTKNSRPKVLYDLVSKCGLVVLKFK